MPDITNGELVTATDFPPSVYVFDDTRQSDISSTTYISGSPIVSVYFVAPTSGRVLLTIGGGLQDSGTANRVHLAPVIREDGPDGATVLAANVVTSGVGCPEQTTSFMYVSRTTLVTGLTPGRTYYAHTAHKVSGGSTGDIASRDLTVVPVP
ncbi:hypothetical protein Aph01nite_59180 [Acrocarpospora phusangensis]|uniref:Uncharacterized protein n=1 Tax=Acrocarpospora phusangensis TaxID=1070424 RepID=A0A919QF49_9ACTN|nr:hypothetical protein [Acrocarpospora phusangensis]GIH27608.1 hypothetical protein Aph01nite_59180 [Acrocarpospora phusangensis]